MRHRSVYVDTAPRPAHEPPKGPSGPRAVKTSSVVVGVVVGLISLGLLLGGLAISVINSTRPLHKKMANEYKQHLEDWHHKHLDNFHPVEVTLILNDKVRIPAHSSTRPAKHEFHGRPPVSDEAPAPTSSVWSLVTGGKRAGVMSVHCEFQASGVMGKLSLPGNGEQVVIRPTNENATDGAADGPESDSNSNDDGVPAAGNAGSVVDRAGQRGEAKGRDEDEGDDDEDVEASLPGGGSHVTTAMLRPANFKIQVVSARGEGGGESITNIIDLGNHSFARIGNATVRGRRDCRVHHWGAWDVRTKRCITIDYLSELCVKVHDVEGESGPRFTLDRSHGGAGCYPKLSWRPEIWRRAKAQVLPLPPGEERAWDGSDDAWEVVLPGPSALLAPRVVVRHGRDPEMKERAMRHEMVKEQQPLMAAHAVGLAMMFLGLVGASTLVCITVPTLATMWQSDEDGPFD